MSSAENSAKKRLQTAPLSLYLAMARYGIAAGILASLAISAIIMLAEGVASLPSGTFYSVLATALVPSLGPSGMVLMFLLHLGAGGLTGLVFSSLIFAGISIKPRLFGAGPRSYGVPSIKYAPLWGLGAGFVLWAGLFLPITYGLIVPLLNSNAGPIVASGQARTGELLTLEKSQLLPMISRIIAASVAFHLFYGMMTAILIKSMYESRIRKEMSEYQSEPVREFLDRT